MASYVIECIDDAAKRTRELLLPFDLSTWSRLALIVLLTGGLGFNFPGFPGFGGGDYEGDYGDPSTQIDETAGMDTSNITGAFSSSGSGILYAGVALFTGIVLLMMFIGSVFEFVYFRSLLDDSVEIAGNFSENLQNGASYFIFQVLFTVATLLLFGGGILAAFITPLALIPLLVAAIPAALILFTFSTLVHDFVLLEMLEQDSTFVESMKQVYGYVRDDLTNTALYLVVRFAVVLLGTSAIGMALLFVLAIAAVPMIFMGIVLAMVSELLIIPLLLFGVLLVFVAALFITVPVKTFIYYYAISVYPELAE